MTLIEVPESRAQLDAVFAERNKLREVLAIAYLHHQQTCNCPEVNRLLATKEKP